MTIIIENINKEQNEKETLSLEIEKIHTFLFNLEEKYKAEETKEIFLILNKLNAQFIKAKVKLLRNESIVLLNQSDLTREKRNAINGGILK